MSSENYVTEADYQSELSQEMKTWDLESSKIANLIAAQQQALLESLVDPMEPYRDDNDIWFPTQSAGSMQGMSMTSETHLGFVRDACRKFALENEFAICGHENRINYLVGPGHKYTVSCPDHELAARARGLLDAFLIENEWSSRQEEIVRRMDRDGECFLRFFPRPAGAGLLVVRFVEPEHVSTPER